MNWKYLAVVFASALAFLSLGTACQGQGKTTTAQQAEENSEEQSLATSLDSLVLERSTYYRTNAETGWSEDEATKGKALEYRSDIDIKSVVPNGNFCFTKQGITWQFNPYEIAPYALGSFTVEIPWSELRPYLKKAFAKYAK